MDKTARQTRKKMEISSLVYCQSLARKTNHRKVLTMFHCPPLRNKKHTLATEPFQPILKVLADLERDDLPAARLVGLYRRLWESCVSKHIDGEKLEQNNQKLKETSMKLSNERDGLQLLHDKQLPRLLYIEEVLEASRERLISLLDDWNHPFRPNLTGLPDVEREV
ncbi:hypothetical protein N7517_002129 [Penicillium concentricum]|uniref:Uncharacterized protein n=1 Tax=Penicillium concentricum TaxID=293559 RepID=A0A9W9VJ81_9EURO|nr:uncharacterized protein N7517_002129 [Penicillium concentricum]KAJ5384218.1 hypothetical protein N7517_002129 [Penicillium concentricum]